MWTELLMKFLTERKLSLYKPVIMTVTLMPGTESSEYGGVSVGVVESRVGIVMMPVGVQCEPPGVGGNE